MNTIQVTAVMGRVKDTGADVFNVLHQSGPVESRREITPHSAKLIASWWQSSGTVGSVLAAFASGCRVDRAALLDDIAATRRTEPMLEWDRSALDCLATFVLNYGKEGVLS